MDQSSIDDYHAVPSSPSILESSPKTGGTKSTRHESCDNEDTLSSDHYLPVLMDSESKCIMTDDQFAKINVDDN